MKALRRFVGLACLLGSAWLHAQGTLEQGTPEQGKPMAESAPRAMTVTGIAPRTNDDDPRVLYILPWQPPTLPRRPRTRLNDRAPGLKEPVDPLTLERHRYFRKTLDPDIDAAVPGQ
ncbi:MAG: hypothetical protein R3303_15685 [Marinobacter sp.]|nr:hypothetical protein [Marinobacter sp.]